MAETPQDSPPDIVRRIFAAQLLDDWPTMSQEEREFVMEHAPHRVRDAGLWPGEEGPPLLDLTFPERPKGPQRRPEWMELPEDSREVLAEYLRKQWPTMSLLHRQYFIDSDPERVKAAGLWPDGLE